MAKGNFVKYFKEKYYCYICGTRIAEDILYARLNPLIDDLISKDPPIRESIADANLLGPIAEFENYSSSE
jgi:hypothetical protein